MSGTVVCMPLDSDPLIDWAAMTDARPHVLIRGTHFGRSPELVRKAAGMWASRNGYRCLTEMGSERLTVRFEPREAVRA